MASVAEAAGCHQHGMIVVDSAGDRYGPRGGHRRLDGVDLAGGVMAWLVRRVTLLWSRLRPEPVLIVSRAPSAAVLGRVSTSLWPRDWVAPPYLLLGSPVVKGRVAGRELRPYAWRRQVIAWRRVLRAEVQDTEQGSEIRGYLQLPTTTVVFLRFFVGFLVFIHIVTLVVFTVSAATDDPQLLGAAEGIGFLLLFDTMGLAVIAVTVWLGRPDEQFLLQWLERQADRQDE